MSKKGKQSLSNPYNLPRRMREGLEDADDLLNQNETNQALELLLELDRKFPHQEDILGSMVNAYFDMQNDQGYLHSIYKLNEVTPNKADVKVGLAGAYLTNGYFALALRTFRQFTKRWPLDDRISDAQKSMLLLEEELQKMLAGLDFSLESGFEFVCQHEELRLNMELGNYGRCELLSKDLLKQRPKFVAVLNNLSQVEWLEGNLAKAIETCQKVLEIEPENVHALSNLTRFLFMQGKKEEATVIAEQLKKSEAEAADRWIKKTEALSFIGDDEGVLAVKDQAKNARKPIESNKMILHWCGVAEYHRGSIARARKYWQKSLESAPFFMLARDNLEELKKPVYERICPQVFPLDGWLPRIIFKDLISIIERASHQKNDKIFKENARAFIDTHPELIHFVPEALANGDNQAREFALQLAEMSEHPNLLASLKDFTLGQQGPDSLRIKASQTLTKNGIMKSGAPVDMWLKGEWRPIMMLGFQITSEAIDRPNLKPAALHLVKQAINALREGNGVVAELHLRNALKIQKDDPGIYNNLAVALGLQGKEDEANAIIDEIPTRFPDYFFGQVVSVRKAIRANELEKARDLLDILLQKTEFHVTEFAALCACQIDFMLQDDKPEGALSWFDMWKSGYPEDPDLKKYEEIMGEISTFTKLKNKFSQGRSKSKKLLEE